MPLLWGALPGSGRADVDAGRAYMWPGRAGRAPAFVCRAVNAARSPLTLYACAAIAAADCRLFGCGLAASARTGGWLADLAAGAFDGRFAWTEEFCGCGAERECPGAAGLGWIGADEVA